MSLEKKRVHDGLLSGGETPNKRSATGTSSGNVNSDEVDFASPFPREKMVQKILSQYNQEQGRDCLDNPTVENMTKLVHSWSPNLPVVCMYSRWSKRLKFNFHLDTISTLLCIAEQTKVSPYDLLNKITTLQITKWVKCCGLSFTFYFSKGREVDWDHLKIQFTSLAVTLRLFHASAVESSIGGSPKEKKKV